MCSLRRSPTGSASGDFIFNLAIAYSGELEIGTRQLNNWRLHVPPDFLPIRQPGALSTRLHCSRMPRHHTRPPGRYTVLTLDIICCVGGELQTHKNSLECTLRYLKYICSLNLMCFTHSFNTFIFTCSATGNLEIMSAIIMLCSGCWLFCKLKLKKVGIK